jgi:NAD(P)H-hydrate epimerase
MEHAGAAVARAVFEEFDRGIVCVVCGKGNNAGDGFVVARLLARRGWPVRVVLLASAAELSGDALRNFNSLPRDGNPEVAECRCREELDVRLQEAEVVVDAILGTGVRGAPRPPMDWAIRALNESGIPIVAVDLPSGLEDAAETSDPSEGPVVRAAQTITMGLPKVALFTTDGLRCAGRVTVAPIGFPADLLESVDLWRNLLSMESMAASLTDRSRQGHKGTFGAVALIGGSVGMSGALMLAGGAAIRSGCGMVYLAPTANALPMVESRLLEPVKWRIGGHLDHLDVAAAREIVDHCRAAGVDAVAIGPGLSRHPDTVAAVHLLAQTLDVPMVVDADALNALAERLDLLRDRAKRGAATILTPHPGEMSRLTGRSIGEIQKTRFATAREFASRHGCALALKGAGTVVASPEGAVYLNPTGNTGLAKGGSGDVLTGLIGGLLAQGHDAVEAACLGAFLHGLAADLAIQDSTPRSLAASDVIDNLGRAYRKIERERT